MRIAVVNQHVDDAVGGSELQCDLVARGLVARGHEVTYLAVEVGAGARGSAPVATPYPVVRVARDPRAIVAACVETRADVVYWRFNRPLLAPVLSGLGDRGIPLVLAVAHIDDVSRWPVRPWPSLRPRGVISEFRARLQERAGWSSLASVSAVASQRGDFVGRIPVDLQRVVRNLVPEAIEPFTWPRPYVAWVGSIQRRKRPELLPALAETIRASGVDLVVAGQLRDPRYADLLTGATPSNLHHLGEVRPPVATGLIAGARALVMTAHEEGFANVLIQAWWHGTPTVALEHDPDCLIVRHGLGAVAGGDPAVLRQRLLGLLDEPRAAASDRREGIRTFARAEFDAGRTLDALEALLDAAVART